MDFTVSVAHYNRMWHRLRQLEQHARDAAQLLRAVRNTDVTWELNRSDWLERQASFEATVDPGPVR